MSSSLAENSNVSDNNHVDSNLHQHNVNSADFGGDYDESDDYKRYLNESITKSEKSKLGIYLEELNMGKKVITPLRSSLKSKTVQAIACFDDWMRAKGFSMEIGYKNDDNDEDDKDDVSRISF
ncbi:hypothetical protein Goari_000906 [Gossypium aridum]|uniref:Uncharacterized protein n=1 Tax=Gossypium aridum TaxID=34290 RepID=A0A7J8YI31_GOSAI|nr:hypothetical protein [Gossypium aridum]